MSEFKYITAESALLNDSRLIQMEIAHQLKRIADALMR